MYRFFVALCLLALVAVSVIAQVEESVNDVSEVQTRSIQGKVVAKIIGEVAAGIAASCIAEAAEHCKDDWKVPVKAINCAKEFFKVNKGRCAAGK